VITKQQVQTINGKYIAVIVPHLPPAPGNLQTKVVKSQLKPASQPQFLWCKPIGLRNLKPNFVG